MKATGIVRRIDDLGRVVIPKEIRRTMRINNGDPLEIYTSENQVIFQKYSSIVNMSEAVKDMLAALYSTHKMSVIACDKEKVVAAKGISDKVILNRRTTEELVGIIEQRNIYAYDGKKETLFQPVEGVERYAIACAPVIASGDVVGAILCLSSDETAVTAASDKQIGLVQVVATYLGKQLGD